MWSPFFLGPRQPVPCRRVLAWLVGVWIVLPSSHLPAGETAQRPPNILLVLVDDLGKEWVGCYGGEGITTPHIDRLAAEGMLFENAYCMPQCTPTRVTLLTGQYPYRHGWVNHWDVPRWGGGCSFDPQRNPSVARLLRDAGYATAAAGKWQIDDFRQEPEAMEAAGFDEYCMWTGFETGVPASRNRYSDPYLHTRDGSRSRPGKFGPDLFVDFLIDFMQRHRDQPQFLFYPMVLTHGPLVATPLEPNAETPLDRHRAMVRYTDHLLGRLLAALERLQLRDQTIVVWTTDNGTSKGISGVRHGRPVRGGKGETTENGVCVPLIASAPGMVPAGVRTDALVDFTDFLPTLGELAGAEIPAPETIDGHSFKQLLLGQRSDGPRSWILSMGGKNQARLTDAGVENKFWFRDRVLRDKRFKLYVGPDRQPLRLVDLQNDPEEKADVRQRNDAETQAAWATLTSVIPSFPGRDNDPIYTPLPHRPWYRSPEAASQVWKTGYPHDAADEATEQR